MKNNLITKSILVGVGLAVLMLFPVNTRGQSYPSSSGDGEKPYIEEVSLAAMQNSSGSSSYSDYSSSDVATLISGQTYTLSVEIKKKNKSYITAWFDWNDDGDFTDSGEEFIVASNVNGSGPYTVSVTVPSLAAGLELRMRVTSKRSSAPTSTESGFKGEVEDYGILIDDKANYFYYVADSDNDLYIINKNTGATTLIGATGVSDIEAISNWPSYYGQVLYACNGGTFGTLNTSTGAFTSIGQVDGGGTADGPDGAQSLNDVDGMAFDPRTGVLWASNRRSGDYDLLFKIDPSTGLFIPDAFGAGLDYIEIAGSGVYQTFDDIAISPEDGVIYGVSNNGSTDQILSIEVPTGNVTVVSSLIEATDVEGLGFSMDNKMYGVEGIQDDFQEIIWTTGASTMINNNIPGGDVESLAALVEDANAIEGRVYHDDNQNQTDDSESGLSGVKVLLYYDENNNNQLDGGDTYLSSTTTDASGNYSFDYAYTGDLVVVVDVSTLPSGYSLTTDNHEDASFSTFSNLDSGNDFGADTGSDCDGDGIPDFTEGAIDSDGDGVDNMCDLDSDNDGILDSEETTGDKDGDGIPNYLDLDSDNDGIPDAIEANGGSAPSGYQSSTGRITGTDTDGDGLLNSVDNASSTAYGTGSTSNLPRGDNDGDGVKDFQDKDSDNDGIMDIVEAGGTDSNGNGEVDSFSDSNSDGYHDALTSSPLSIPNTDGSWESTHGLTVLPNYLDLDSDNDAIDDGKEGYSTLDYQIPSVLTDTDGDGVLDLFDSNSGGAAITPNDHDEDGDPDYIDLDSDDDGIDDNIEGNDANIDYVNDDSWSNADTDGHGIDDTFDNNCSGVTTLSLTPNTFGEEDLSDGDMYTTSSDLELVNDGSTHQTIGLQYSAVNIPQGASIQEAYIQFEVDESSTGSVTFTIRAEDIDNSLAISNADDDLSDRNLTSSSITWSPSNWNTVGESGANQRTGNMKSIIQEVVNRSGWSSGNSLTIIITGADNESNYRTAETDPTLVIMTSGGLSYACGTDIALQDEDDDGEHDFRDDQDDSGGLPIELLDLTAEEQDERVRVVWTTASELNNDYFEVQRSIDGENFETIAQVAGAGTSQELNSYAQIDYMPLEGQSYYRLKQVDFDGSYSYSKHVKINRDRVDELHIYPNPAEGEVFVQAEGQGSIMIYNLSGQLVERIEHVGGNTSIRLDHLPGGVYTIVYVTAQSKQMKKLIVR